MSPFSSCQILLLVLVTLSSYSESAHRVLKDPLGAGKAPTLRRAGAAPQDVLVERSRTLTTEYSPARYRRLARFTWASNRTPRTSRGCDSYGQSCWGAHGKRASPNVPSPASLPALPSPRHLNYFLPRALLPRASSVEVVVPRGDEVVEVLAYDDHDEDDTRQVVLSFDPLSYEDTRYKRSAERSPSNHVQTTEPENQKDNENDNGIEGRKNLDESKIQKAAMRLRAHMVANWIRR